MTSFYRDDLGDEIEHALRQINAGIDHADAIKATRIDLKEEAGCRGMGGELQASVPENEAAAKALAAECTCMANTPGGGALIVGVSDVDGTVIGTKLDIHWLRSRIYDLTQGQITAQISQVLVQDKTLLVVRLSEALQPVAWRQKYTWRQGRQCVPVTTDQWHSLKRQRENYDWSSLDSRVPVSRVSPIAVEIVREFLTESAEERSLELAEVPTPDLLLRLNVVVESGDTCLEAEGLTPILREATLTNAGALLFTPRPTAALDYIYRPTRGADSEIRLNRNGTTLLQELRDVLTQVSARTSLIHTGGFARGQIPDLPPLAVREAIVNGLAHRDWENSDPTLVEHTGNQLSVISPGGFPGTVRSDNIITHPSTPRYRALTEVFATLRIAERQGIGVDRMVREMLRLGFRAPDITEIDGPRVRTVLVGGMPDLGWVGFLSKMDSAQAAINDLDILAIFAEIDRRGWADSAILRALLQRSVTETEDALERAAHSRIADTPVIMPVQGLPRGSTIAWVFSKEAFVELESLREQAGTAGPIHDRSALAVEYAAHRGRISSTELASLTHNPKSAGNMGRVLRELEDEGILVPSRANRAGPGFHYRYVP